MHATTTHDTMDWTAVIAMGCSGLFAFVGEPHLMTAQLVTCLAEGQFRTESLFENAVPMMRNTPQKSHFKF